jgi:hypothetical protein
MIRTAVRPLPEARRPVGDVFVGWEVNPGGDRWLPVLGRRLRTRGRLVLVLPGRTVLFEPDDRVLSRYVPGAVAALVAAGGVR